jgi:phosphonate transport system substrate-binding protein
MDTSRRRRVVALVLLCLVVAVTGATSPGVADDKSGTLRFGVGPLQPTPSETKKAYEPFFAYLAKQLNREFDLVATTDWAGISVALANQQVDLA